MKITQDVREYAAAHGMSEEQAVATGMAQKAAEFTDGGKDFYRAP